jgi:hypothetical protein
MRRFVCHQSRSNILQFRLFTSIASPLAETLLDFLPAYFLAPGSSGVNFALTYSFHPGNR